LQNCAAMVEAKLGELKGRARNRLWRVRKEGIVDIDGLVVQADYDNRVVSVFRPVGQIERKVNDCNGDVELLQTLDVAGGRAEPTRAQQFDQTLIWHWPAQICQHHLDANGQAISFGSLQEM